MCIGCRCGERGLEYNIESGELRILIISLIAWEWIQPASSLALFLAMRGTLGCSQENTIRSKYYRLKSEQLLLLGLKSAEL